MLYVFKSFEILFYFFIFTEPLALVVGQPVPETLAPEKTTAAAAKLISRACVGIAPHIQDVHVELPSVLLFFLREIPGTRN
jgi:sorbitol-specific phosphotransferase system component IIC